MVFIIGSSFVCMMFLFASLYLKSLTLVFISLGLYGFFLIPIIGIGYTFTAMNFLPISPASSCGIVHISVALSSTALASIVSIYVETKVWYSLGALAISNILGLIAALLVRETVSKENK